MGILIHNAVNDPKELKKLEPKRQQADELDMNALPGMLRIPKKNVNQNGQ